MDDLQATLQSLLDNPAELEHLAETAKAFLGEDASPAAEPGMLDLQTIMKKLQGGSGEKQNLLEAIKPYLSAERQERLARAAKIARIAHIAEFAFGSEDADG